MAEKKRKEILENLRQVILKKECELGKWNQLEEDMTVEVLEIVMDIKIYN